MAGLAVRGRSERERPVRSSHRRAALASWLAGALVSVARVLVWPRSSEVAAVAQLEATLSDRRDPTAMPHDDRPPADDGAALAPQLILDRSGSSRKARARVSRSNCGWRDNLVRCRSVWNSPPTGSSRKHSRTYASTRVSRPPRFAFGTATRTSTSRSRIRARGNRMGPHRTPVTARSACESGSPAMAADSGRGAQAVESGWSYQRSGPHTGRVPDDPRGTAGTRGHR